MKPRVLCGECGAEIAVGEDVCGKCGAAIEWSDEPETIPAGTKSETRSCPSCGTENLAGSDFCSSCGAKLQGGKGGQKRKEKALRQSERARGSKKSESGASPLFSPKVIFGFLGALVLLVAGLEIFGGREPAPASPPVASGPAQIPAANLQVMNQIADLEKRVAADPSDMQATLTLANMCQDGRFFDKAITYYKKFLAKNPKDANARVDLGICYFEKDDTGEAIKEMQTALKYEPKHVQAHYNLGIVNLKARKLQDANEWFRKTIALAGPNSEMGKQAKQILEQHSSPLIQNQ